MIEDNNKDFIKKAEIPVITIERDESPSDTMQTDEFNEVKKPQNRLFLSIFGLGIGILLCVIGYAVLRYFNPDSTLGLYISVTAAENVEKLKQSVPKADVEVVMTEVEVLDVPIELLELKGLRAEISFIEPDTADTNVFFYSRCADHEVDNSYIGSMVVAGEEYQNDRSRAGYCGMVGNNIVLGVSYKEDVKKYAEKAKGYFFRQYILVSDGEIPRKFYLHGKVERCAMGRIGNTLYAVKTKFPETMSAFAEALREYGFTDAIYITGGRDYYFYRSADGVRHDVGDINKYPHQESKGVIPWLVFTRAK